MRQQLQRQGKMAGAAAGCTGVGVCEESSKAAAAVAVLAISFSAHQESIDKP
jgi:hypothetical protein